MSPKPKHMTTREQLRWTEQQHAQTCRELNAAIDALQQIAAMPELRNAGLGSDAYHAWLVAHAAIAKAEGRDA